MRSFLTTFLAGLLLAQPATALALQAPDPSLALPGDDLTGIEIAQKRDGMSLSEATAMVRRQTGGRIVSAVTKVQGGREVHHIKVLTKDNQVRMHRVSGRRVR